MPGNVKHHTDKFRRCVEEVTAKGNSEDSAYAICTTSLKKAGEPIFEAAEAGSDEEMRLLDEAGVPDEMRALHLRCATGPVRVAELHGRPHLVVPVIALMEGVIHAVNASTPEFVPERTLIKAASSWNGRPVVLRHPIKGGRQCSANSPDIVDSHGIGQIFNSRVEKKRLLQEAWIDKAKLQKLHPQMHDRLLAGQQEEVSVGAFVHADGTPGTFNGKTFIGSWKEATGDHLAFLPEGRGACSIAMGCGAMRAAADGSEIAEEPPLNEIHEDTIDIVTLGGKGSGNFGHEGRPGHVGGSAPDGGGSVSDAERRYPPDLRKAIDEASEELRGRIGDTMLMNAGTSKSDKATVPYKLTKVVDDLAYFENEDGKEVTMATQAARLFMDGGIPKKRNLEEGAPMDEEMRALVEELRAAESVDAALEILRAKGYDDCPTCGSNGSVDGNPCPTCDGKGKIRAAGGKGSGFFDHEGRPGHVGGSASERGGGGSRVITGGKNHDPNLKAEHDKEQDTQDWVASYVEKGNSAIDIWMSPESQMELHGIVKAGGKVKSVSASIDGDDKDKYERWEDKQVDRMKKAGFELFDKENNTDSHELVFVKKGDVHEHGASHDPKPMEGEGKDDHEGPRGSTADSHEHGASHDPKPMEGEGKDDHEGPRADFSPRARKFAQSYAGALESEREATDSDEKRGKMSELRKKFDAATSDKEVKGLIDEAKSLLPKRWWKTRNLAVALDTEDLTVLARNEDDEDCDCGEKDCEKCNKTTELPAALAAREPPVGDPTATPTEEQIRAAAGHTGCGCKKQGDSKMTPEQKADVIKSLVTDKHSGFTAGDERMLEAASDERLESFRVAAESRKTQEQELRAAASKQLSAEEFMQAAPPELKALIERQQETETRVKADLVTELRAAQSEYSDAELSIMPVAELTRLARLTKVDTKIDFSGRGVPRSLASSKDDDYTPPNAYGAVLAKA